MNLFRNIPFNRINWTTSSFLIGTFVLAVTAVPAYIFFFGLSWFNFALFFVMSVRHGHEHHARVPPVVFALRLPGQVAGQVFSP